MGSGVSSSLRSIESGIKTLSVEHSYILDEHGNILAHNIGDTNRVEGDYERFRDKNVIITHNHPEDVSFSDADIITAVNVNAKEIRATANGHTYSLKRPKGGWGIPKGTFGALKITGEYMGHSSEHRGTWQSTLLKKAKAGDSDTMAWVHSQLGKGQHYAVSKMAKQYGWKYTINKN